MPPEPTASEGPRPRENENRNPTRADAAGRFGQETPGLEIVILMGDCFGPFQPIAALNHGNLPTHSVSG